MLPNVKFVPDKTDREQARGKSQELLATKIFFMVSP